MSALDQAFIKAYAKDPPPSSAAVAAAPSPVRAAASRARAAADHSIEQVYHDGSLYRVDAPSPRPSTAAGVPAPHLKLLPPTSPRRGVRRSVLKLLTGLPSYQRRPTASALHGISLPAQGPTPARAAASEPPAASPRIARKVIIRHVSHSALPPPLGREKAVLVPARTDDDIADSNLLYAELPPEAIREPQAPAPSEPAVPALPPLPLDPARALDQPVVAVVLPQSPTRPLTPAATIAVHGTWDAAAMSPLVFVAHPAEIEPPGPEALVTPQVVELRPPTPSTPTLRVGATEPQLSPPESAHAEHGPTGRLDAAHPPSPQRPHVRFDRSESDDAVKRNTLATESNRPGHEQLEPEEIQSLLGEHDDSTPAPRNTATKHTARLEPLWEVDRFHWPRTCEKLLADTSGYFAHAGDKLLAAAKDGLRVLGITGSRRGEGRTTLTLCLARAAAQAGLNVAIMDADFTRPQLASRLGVEAAHGWQDAAIGKVPLSEAAIKSLEEHITVLPLDTSAAGSRLSLADPRVTAIVRQTASEFDLVILDLGPLEAGQSLSFPPGEGCPLDAAIVVRDLRFATLAESEGVGQSLYEAGNDAVGIAENFVVEEASVRSA